MKKSKLIELLSQIEGDPEIKLWNGFVGDWADINPTFVDQELVKQSLDYIYKCLMREWQRDNQTFDVPPVDVDSILREVTQKQFKAQQWELPSPYLTLEDYKEWYGKHKKRIVIINHKSRGKSQSDRVGDMYY